MPTCMPCPSHLSQGGDAAECSTSSVNCSCAVCAGAATLQGVDEPHDSLLVWVAETCKEGGSSELQLARSISGRRGRRKSNSLPYKVDLPESLHQLRLVRATLLAGDYMQHMGSSDLPISGGAKVRALGLGSIWPSRATVGMQLPGVAMICK
jgi:hypothetical protein